MDAEYVKKTVGPALTAALAHIAQQQPEDPIEYLSAYLHKHAENTRRAEATEREREQIKVLEEDARVQAEHAAELKREEERIQAEEKAKAAAAPAPQPVEQPPAQTEPTIPEEPEPAAGEQEQDTSAEPAEARDSMADVDDTAAIQGDGAEEREEPQVDEAAE